MKGTSSNSSRRLQVLILLFLVSFITVVTLIHPGLPMTHDGKDQVARTANFYKNITEGIVVPRWAANLNWGYGHPILEFLYPLPSYIASFFKSLGFSFIDAIKIVFAIGMLFSTITMYLWLSEFVDLPSAFIGGMLYLFAPYRFIDTYVRGDIGENLAYVFMPLMLFFLYRLYKTNSSVYTALAAISFALLITAHNAVSLMYLPLLLLYCLYLFWRRKDRKLLLHFLGVFLAGFGLAAFFWIPALLEGRFTLRNIVTKGEYTSRFVTLQALFYGAWNYGGTGLFSVQIGIVQVMLFFISIWSLFSYYIRKNISFFVLTVGAIVCSLIGVFFMLPISRFIWAKVILLQNFQFPWRFLSITLVTTAILGALVVYSFPKKSRMYAAICLTLVILFFNWNYWKANGYLLKPDAYFSGVYDATTDTGESAPIWSVRFMEKRAKGPIEIIDGVGLIVPISRTSVAHVYKVMAYKTIRLRENTLFFPGWEVFVDNRSVPIQFQDAENRGLMTFFVPDGVHTVAVKYRETKLRLASDVVSILSIIFVIFLLLKEKVVLHEKHR